MRQYVFVSHDEKETAMSQEHTAFDTPDYFEAEALGQPGNRRFRLIARQGVRTACLWLERADVELLIQGIQQTLTEITHSDILRVEGSQDLPPAPLPRTDFPSEPDVEFQVGRWALGYDQTDQMIIFVATSLETALQSVDDEEIIPEFRVMLAPDDAEDFAEHAEAVVAAGRPRCPLCGLALDYPDQEHTCTGKNGHHKLVDEA
jgi:uncharacterized repeat protein (TIGR03847 family)